MNIAFTTNFDKTEYYHAIAAELERLGHRVSWIASSRTWSDWLIQRGVDRSRIFRAFELADAWRRVRTVDAIPAADLQFLARLSERNRDWTPSHLVLTDRVLSKRPYPPSLAMLATVARGAEGFLRENDIQLLVSEQSWAFEIVVLQVANRLGALCVNPHPARIPVGRFGFFVNPLQEELVPLRPPAEADEADASAIVDTYRAKPTKPERFAELSKVPTPRLSWSSGLVRHLRRSRTDSDDAMRYPVRWLVAKKASEILNARAMRVGIRFEASPAGATRPFVFMTLHKQPESTVDVLGGRIADQEALVKVVARSLPPTHDLFVKEHSHAIGDRPRGFYRRVSRLPGVRLVEPFSDSRDWILRSDLVVTVSGTVAYEAGLLGKRALTFTPMYFGPLLVANGVQPYADEGWLRKALEHPLDRIERAAVPFVADLLRRTVPGYVGDPRNAPGSMHPDNILAVVRGFELLIASRSRLHSPSARA